MRWPWEPKVPDTQAEPDMKLPIRSEEVEQVKDQLEEWQHRLQVVEQRIERLPPAAAR